MFRVGTIKNEDIIDDSDCDFIWSMRWTRLYHIIVSAWKPEACLGSALGSFWWSVVSRIIGSLLSPKIKFHATLTPSPAPQKAIALIQGVGLEFLQCDRFGYL